MVIDYSQTINKFTLLDAYPLPNVDYVVRKVASYKVFSSIDLKDAYHQIPLLPEERHFTAFEACGKLYEFTRIPFGVTNGVASFQRVIDTIIQDERLEGVVAYLDDITVCGKTSLEHDQNLAKFLQSMQKYGIVINQQKTQYSQETVKLLGHLITYQVIKPDPDRLKPLLELPPPTNTASLKRTMGFFAYYAKWIPKFSDKIQHLVNTKSFPLSEKALDAFEKLKEEVTNATITTVSSDRPLTVETDASDVALSAVLSQDNRPVAFFSRTLSKGEKCHSAIEKEAAAIMEALRKWKMFLIGKSFKLITDQQALSFIFNMKLSSKIKNDKVARWRIELAPYDYEIVYRPGIENIKADMLSRVCGAIYSPNKLFELHQALCHPGISRMVHWIRSRNLPYSVDEIKKMTSQCTVCAQIKPRFCKYQGQLIKATAPMERLNVDFKGPLPTTNKNRYILTIVDEYSRFPFAFACSDISSSTVMRCFTKLFTLTGLPAFIHSDRGSSFMSHDITSFLNSLGVATSRSTPYNPRGNGQVERYNGIVWKTINLSLKSKDLPITKWEEVLDDALHAIRSLLCTSTNCTPHERFFAYHRRSANGAALPEWLLKPGTVLVKNNVRTSKYDDLVEEVDLIHANPEYAWIKKKDGSETTVSLRQLAPRGSLTMAEETIPDKSLDEPFYSVPEIDPSHLILRRSTSKLNPTFDSPCEVQEIPEDKCSSSPRPQRTRQRPSYLKDYVL
jgi:transposase InsO family protein